MFATVAALWGASYLFIKVALEDGVGPAAIVFGRVALAAAVLLPLAARLGALEGIRGRVGPVALLALVQVVGPFTLITLGERELSSSLTGILVAGAPIFTFLLAFALTGAERPTRLSLAGVGVGIAGVALLLGVDTGGGTAALVGGLLVVTATSGYAIGAWYLRRSFADAEPVGVLAGTMTVSAIVTLPFALLDLPERVPDADALASIVALGALGTGLAFLCFYSLVRREGPARASLVAYVAPAFSVAYGVTLLGESFTLATAAGLMLIIVGSWLAAEGRLPWRPRERLAASEAPGSAAPDPGRSAGPLAVGPAGRR
jgi:drug/metabolite transporter (DMT)-like permease